jgi:hypothetical protein
MTIQGDKPPALRHPEFDTWIREMQVRTEALIAAADQSGVDKAARKATTIKLDGRQLTLETALGTLLYHAEHEYPSLLRGSKNRDINLGAIQASNMNDRYWLIKLRDEPSLQNPAVQAAINHLSDHLNAVPSFSDPPSK